MDAAALCVCEGAEGGAAPLRSEHCAPRALRCVAVGEPASEVATLFAAFVSPAPMPLPPQRLPRDWPGPPPLVQFVVIEAATEQLLRGYDVAILVASPAHPLSFRRLEEWRRRLAHLRDLQWVIVAARVELLALPSVLATLQERRIAPVRPSEFLAFHAACSGDSGGGSAPEASPEEEDHWDRNAEERPRRPAVFAVSRRVERGTCLDAVIRHVHAIALRRAVGGRTTVPGAVASAPPDARLAASPLSGSVDEEDEGGWLVLPPSAPQDSASGDASPGASVTPPPRGAQFIDEWTAIVRRQMEKLANRAQWVAVREGGGGGGGGVVYYNRLARTAVRTTPRPVVEAALRGDDGAAAPDRLFSGSAGDRERFAHLFAAAEEVPAFKTRKATVEAQVQQRRDQAAAVEATRATFSAAVQKLEGELRELAVQRDAHEAHLEQLRGEKRDVQRLLALRQVATEEAQEEADFLKRKEEASTVAAALDARIARARAFVREADVELPRRVQEEADEFVARWGRNKDLRHHVAELEQRAADIRTLVAEESAHRLEQRLNPRLEALRARIATVIDEYDAATDEVLCLHAKRWWPTGAGTRAPQPTPRSKAASIYRCATADTGQRLSATMHALAAHTTELMAVSADLADVTTRLGLVLREDVQQKASAAAAAAAAGVVQTRLLAWRAALAEEGATRRMLCLAEEEERLRMLCVPRHHHVLRLAHAALRAHQWKLHALQ